MKLQVLCGILLKAIEFYAPDFLHHSDENNIFIIKGQDVFHNLSLKFFKSTIIKFT